MTNDTKQSVEKELAEYKEQKANILGPSTKMDGLSEFHKVIVDSVTLSINPVDGDIYKYKDGHKDTPAQYILTGQALQRLAICAGVAWNPIETKATSISQKYVAYNAVGCIRKADGLPVCYQAEYDVDIDVEEDKLRDQFKEKRKKWEEASWFQKMSPESQDDYIESAIRKELNFKKTHKTKIAATGAKNRVIRALLGVKKTYTIVELKKPFVMPRVILQPDYSDPEVKKMMLTAAIQAQTGVFGPAPSQAPVIDIPSGDYDIRPVPEDIDEPEPAPSDNKDEPAAMPKDVFESLPAAEQQLELEERAKAKGYDLSGLKDAEGESIAIAGMDDHNRIRFFEHLEAIPMPKIQEKIDNDDIPF